MAYLLQYLNDNEVLEVDSGTAIGTNTFNLKLKTTIESYENFSRLFFIDSQIRVGLWDIFGTIGIQVFQGGSASTYDLANICSFGDILLIEYGYDGTEWRFYAENESSGANHTITSNNSAPNITSSSFEIGSSSSNRVNLNLYSVILDVSSATRLSLDDTTFPSTGTTWPDSVNSNDGTLVDFSGTANSWWEYYDDGGSISASVAPTITKPVFSVSSSFVAPVTISADIAYTIAKPIFATAASKVVPAFTSDLAFNVAKPVFATTASITVPTFTSALAVDISTPIFAVSAENGQLVITSAIAASISKPVFSVTADNQVLIINSAIALSVSKPIFSVASSSIVPIFTVNTAFDVTKPIFSIASTATEPGNASASIAVLVDAPIFSISASLINPLLSTIDFSIDAPVFSVLNSATRPTLNAEITVDVTAPTFSVIANNGIQVYYYRPGTQVITYSQNTQIKIRTLNTNQPLYTSARHRKI
jgi:hypothetical protein